MLHICSNNCSFSPFLKYYDIWSGIISLCYADPFLSRGINSGPMMSLYLSGAFECWVTIPGKLATWGRIDRSSSIKWQFPLSDRGVMKSIFKAGQKGTKIN